MTEFATAIKAYQQRIETALDYWLPAESTYPERLHKAMRYAVLGGGKRLRPVLTYTTGQILGLPLRQLDGLASAIEIIHCYSLVHDDLPAMDDDPLRRGRPTCHIAFDEATAILAGDALQALSFYIITHDDRLAVSPEIRLQIIDRLAQACGSRGMAGGQAIDLQSVGKELSIVQLEDMHIHKTGALIRASITLAALCSEDVTSLQLEKLDHFAKCIGLAFQIQDDILDEISDTATLGKPQGSDKANDKPTYPSIAGLREARNRAEDLHQEAIDALAEFGPQAALLREAAAYIVQRNR